MHPVVVGQILKRLDGEYPNIVDEHINFALRLCKISQSFGVASVCQIGGDSFDGSIPKEPSLLSDEKFTQKVNQIRQEEEDKTAMEKTAKQQELSKAEHEKKEKLM